MEEKSGKRLSFVHDPGAIFLFPPNLRPGERKISAAALEQTVEIVVANGADRFISEIYGKVAWYPSEVCSPGEHLKWFESFFGKEARSPWVQFAAEGNDFIRILCDKTHEKGAEYWLSYRLNDHHWNTFQVTAQNADATHVSRFYMEHQDLRIGEEQGNFVWTKYLLDMQYPAVREYKLAMIEELIRNYDIDGFIVDFLRTPALFNQHTTTEKKRREIVLDFLGRIRAMLDRKTERTGKKYPFGVKIPLTMGFYSNLGIDIKAFGEIGVDTFYLFDYFNVVQDYQALDEVRKQCPQSQAILEMGHVTTWFRNLSPEKPRSMRLATKEQFQTTAYVAYKHGAAGVSLFNFPWYLSQTENDRSYDPPFELFPILKDPSALSRMPQHYFEAATENKMANSSDLEAVVWNPGDRHSFQKEMCPPAGGWKHDGVLRLESLEIVQELDFEVLFNGVRLPKTVVCEEPYETPYRNLLGTPENWLAFSIPKEIFREGSNTVEICNRSDRVVRFYYIDVSVS